jgi:hypothetical protein
MTVGFFALACSDRRQPVQATEQQRVGVGRRFGVGGRFGVGEGGRGQFVRHGTDLAQLLIFVPRLLFLRVGGARLLLHLTRLQQGVRSLV